MLSIYTVRLTVPVLRSSFIAAKVWHMRCSGVLALRLPLPCSSSSPNHFTPATARQAVKILSRITGGDGDSVLCGRRQRGDPPTI